MTRHKSTSAAIAFITSLIGCTEEPHIPVLPSIDPLAENVQEVEQAFRTGWWGDGHEEITRDGLSFLKSHTKDDIVDGNVAVDGNLGCGFGFACAPGQLDSTLHADNCRIGETFSYINYRYRYVADALSASPPNYAVALSEFGSILHTMQDFIAHSNWVEAGQFAPVHQSQLYLPSLKPGDLVGPLAWVATPMPSGWIVQSSSDARVPNVWNGNSWLSGLISGTYEHNTDSHICHSSASIEHGDPFNQDGYGSYLAKDDPDSHYHGQAVATAVLQTTEEFCRLVRIVSLTKGQVVRDDLLAEWVSDSNLYRARCPLGDGLVTALWTTII